MASSADQDDSTSRSTERKSVGQIPKDEGARRPVSIDDQNDGRVRLTRKSNECPVTIGCAPELHAETWRRAHAIEGMRPSVDMDGDSRLGDGFAATIQDRPRLPATPTLA